MRNAFILFALVFSIVTAADPGRYWWTGSAAPDETPPSVQNVTSSTANGTYITTQTISIQVVFSEVVYVTGTPQLTLETGSSDAVVNYSSGTGTNTLVFSYTVQGVHSSADLDYAGTSALAFNGGNIEDAAGNNATLTLVSPGASGSLGANKALVIDGWVNRKSIVLDGSTEYVVIPYQAAMKPLYTAPFSVSVWYKKTTSDNRTIVANVPYPDGNITGLSLNQAATAYYYFCKNYGAGEKLGGNNSAAPSTSAWHHYVLTLDGNGTDAGAHIYIDSVDQSLSHPDSASPQSGAIGGTNPWRIGGRTSYTDYFIGGVDEVYFYSGTALSQSDVTALYNGGVPPDPRALSSYANMSSGYHLGDGSDTISQFNDFKGTNHAAHSGMESGDIVTDVP